MLLQMYVIRDCLAEESSAPMLAKNDGVAKVMYANALRDRPYETTTSFKLLHVGMMDTETTVITVTSIRELNADGELAERFLEDNA